MKQIIDKASNRVNYGCYDELIDFNYQDYVLHNFLDRKVSRFKQKIDFHKFNFTAITTDQYIVGLAVIDVAFKKNIFAFVYEKNKGILVQVQTNVSNGRIKFDSNPDACNITCRNSKLNLDINKELNSDTLSIHFEWFGKISITLKANYGLKNKPLRVLNPSDFDHWTFTEKLAGLQAQTVEVICLDKTLSISTNNALICSDWSAGYYRRNTNWIWGCANTKVDNKVIGFNFATFINNALYPENAIWVDGERKVIPRVIFEWDYNDPYHHAFKIHNEEYGINLSFQPLGEKSDKKSRGFGLIKTNFRQFFGIYKGYITFDNKKIDLGEFLGLFELHKSLW